MLRDNMPIALPLHLAVDNDDLAGIDFDQAPADMGSFIVPFKCEISEAQIHVTETCAGGTTTPVVALDLRPTLGSDASRGAADIANFVLGTTAAGKVIYDKAARGTILEPGDEVVVQLVTQATGTGAAGHGIPCLLVVPIPEVDGNLSGKVVTA